MKLVFNPLTGNFDYVLDEALFLKLTGGTLTGDVFFPVTGFIMASTSYQWRITIDDSGTLVSELYVTEPYLNFSNADDSMYIGVI